MKNIEDTNGLLLSTGFQLIVTSVNRVTNDEWYMAADNATELLDMYDQLKTGGLDTLNVYYKAALGGDGVLYCGYAYLAEGAPYVGTKDGVVVDSGCAGDKTTLAHEVGTSMGI